MAELVDLIRRRGIIKGHFTRLENFLGDYTADKYNQLTIRWQKCESGWDAFQNIQSDIEIIDDSEEQTNERIIFEEIYFDLMGRAKGLLESSGLNVVERRISPDTTNGRRQEVGGNTGVPLPPIEVPKFSGSYKEWPQFRNAFETVVEQNKRLTVYEKLYYLKTSVTGEAADVISSLTSEDADYKDAWDMLKEEYENKKYICYGYLESLYEFPVIKEESYGQLKRFLNEVRKCIRSIRNLGQPVDQWDTLLIFHLEKKLDPSTKRAWKRELRVDQFPNMDGFLNFLSHRCKMIEPEPDTIAELKVNKKGISLGINNKQNMLDDKRHGHSSRTMLSSAETTTRTKRVCSLCKEGHPIYICKQFLALGLTEKRNRVLQDALCWNCLCHGHRAQHCTYRACKHCGKKHNSLLHEYRQPTVADNTSQGDKGRLTDRVTQENNQTMSTLVGTTVDDGGFKIDKGRKGTALVSREANLSEVLLSTALVNIEDELGRLCTCRALLDSGSQSSFMTKELRGKLGLSLKKIKMSILGIGQGLTNINHFVTTNINSRVEDFSVKSSFLVIDKISGRVPSVKGDLSNVSIPENLRLADQSFSVPGDIDILLGANIFWDLVYGDKLKLQSTGLTLQNTTLGWIVTGSMHCNKEDSIVKRDRGLRTVGRCQVATNVTVQEQLEKFWLTEEWSYDKSYSQEEELCESIFKESTIRDESGRFVVSLPMRENAMQLGDSYSRAVKRLEYLEKKLEKNEEFKQQYHEFMQEYLELGHMSKLDLTNELNWKEVRTTNREMYFLPHHGILKASSVTTKLRVVFDASAESDNGISLNDKLLVGPKIQDDIACILLRFREHKIVFTADIAKMYRQVLVTEDHRDLQCILWRSSPGDPIQIFRLNTVTYGTAPASFLAVRCLHELGLQNEGKFPIAARVIAKDFYMDDLLSGAETVEEAKRLKLEMSTILDSGGFILRKWMSNRKEVLLDNDNRKDIDHYLSEEGSDHKTLGLIWNSELDLLRYKVNLGQPGSLTGTTTKRVVLSSIARIFDPLGLVGPVVLKAKHLLQRLWKERLDWDDQVSEEIRLEWERLRSGIIDLDLIEIPRRVMCDNTTDIQLHCFCDASQIAYGASIYVRSTDNCGNHSVQLYCSKSRVAPLKVITLPRLELCGSLLSARLFSEVIKSINFTPRKVVFWTDSTIVLSWLAAESSKWKTFVSNRVSEIQTLTNSYQWRHIRSEDNPADVLSRGLQADSLRTCELWWKGPKWLSDGEEFWPRKKYTADGETIPEEKPVKTINVFMSRDYLGIFNKHSSIVKLQRVIAFCLRFKENCGNQKASRQVGSLTVAELDKSMTIIIKYIQTDALGSELRSLREFKAVAKNSKILPLNPFLDDNGLLRVGGRLENAPELTFEQKHPIILPSHRLTKLIILQEHYKNLHAGPQALLANIRLRFWPITGRNIIRSVLHGCVVCFKVKPRDYKFLMGNLPKDRVTPTRPFTNCGVDFAGPFDVKISKIRGYRTTKAYLCAFVCFATKAVHLELVSDLSTPAFLNCFKRFIARRGICSNIYSDNGTNFAGAVNELSRLYEFLLNPKNQSTFSDYFSQNRVQWHFIPPRSPHFGGLWESVIKSAKYHIRRVVGKQRLTYEELETVIVQAESCLNSRPLVPLSDDPDDLSVLTPAHFLIGSSMFAAPQEDVGQEAINRLTRYQLVTQLAQGFWKSWSKDYLSQLQRRNKWREIAGPNKLMVGSMVLLKDENLPPLQWQLGRIAELHFGHDSECRVVSVKTAKGCVKRADSKIVLLPNETDSSD